MLPPEVLNMRTIILCGGKGTRAYPYTLDLPKPLLDVAGRPILQHVMEIFTKQGFRRFVLAAGYRSDMIRAFVAGLPAGLDVEVVDTGEDSNTGARIKLCASHVGDQFFVTYADGVGNVDLSELLSFHMRAGGAATLTTIPLPSQYGTVDTDEVSGRVLRFREKPHLPDHWINGGFFVMEQRVFDNWVGEDLENEVLPALAGQGTLHAYRHYGFWKSMDTYKDALELTRLAQSDTPPWLEDPTPPIRRGLLDQDDDKLSAT